MCNHRKGLKAARRHKMGTKWVEKMRRGKNEVPFKLGDVRPSARLGRPARALLYVSVLAAVAGGGLGGGVAAAEAAPNIPIWGRIADDVRTAGPQIIQMFPDAKPNMFSGSAVSRMLPRAGNFIKWGGAYVVAPMLVNEAMRWFYDEAKKSTGTDLDKWYRSQGLGSPLYPFPETHYQHMTPGTSPIFLCNTSGGTVWSFHNRYINSYETFLISGNGVPGSYSGSCAAPALRDLSPAGQAALGDAVSQYVQSNPEAVRSALDPVANVNQWRDDPYADPECKADTDGDGVPDCVEHEMKDEGGDPNDPNKLPSTEVREVSRKTTTTRLPNGGSITTTRIDYSDGSSKVIEVRREVTIWRDPITGELVTTAITTTTTTRTTKEGQTKTEQQQKREERREPRPDPLPDPDPEGDADKDGIPNKDDPDRKEELQKEAEKKQEEEKKKEEEQQKMPDAPPLGDNPKFEKPKFDDLQKTWDESLQKLSDTAKDRFPFGLKNPMEQFKSMSVAGSPCPPLNVTFGTVAGTALGGTINVCDTPMAKTSHEVIRPMLAWLLIGMTVVACARIAGSA